MTFSLVARDPATGEVGVGAVTAMVGVGKLVSHARARVGAGATQAMINPYLALHGLDHLAAGASAQEALDRVLAADPGRDFRQVGLIGVDGDGFAWTGSQTPDWAGHLVDEDVVVQGNRLVGPQTLEAVVDAFRTSRDDDLAWRLLAALEAGERTGADKQGAVSGAITVMSAEAYPLWDVRVDHADHPVVTLRHQMEEFAEELIPQIRKMSTLDDQEGELVREQRASAS